VFQGHDCKQIVARDVTQRFEDFVASRRLPRAEHRDDGFHIRTIDVRAGYLRNHDVSIGGRAEQFMRPLLYTKDMRPLGTGSAE